MPVWAVCYFVIISLFYQKRRARLGIIRKRPPCCLLCPGIFTHEIQTTKAIFQTFNFSSAQISGRVVYCIIHFFLGIFKCTREFFAAYIYGVFVLILRFFIFIAAYYFNSNIKYGLFHVDIFLIVIILFVSSSTAAGHTARVP